MHFVAYLSKKNLFIDINEIFIGKYLLVMNLRYQKMKNYNFLLVAT